MKKWQRLVVTLVAATPAFFGMTSAVYAVPIDYELTFTVDEVGLLPHVGGICDPTYGDAGGGEVGGFNCDWMVNDVFYGSFTVDSDTLPADGSGVNAATSDFRIQITDALWDQSAPDPASLFSGFRGPGLDAPSPAYNVVDGEIVSLFGGVYGPADASYVDLFDETYSTPYAFVASDDQTFLRGTYTLNPVGVSAPAALLLFLPVTAVLVWMRRFQGNKIQGKRRIT